jgi:hypothetical protein
MSNGNHLTPLAQLPEVCDNIRFNFEAPIGFEGAQLGVNVPSLSRAMEISGISNLRVGHDFSESSSFNGNFNGQGSLTAVSAKTPERSQTSDDGKYSPDFGRLHSKVSVELNNQAYQNTRTGKHDEAGRVGLMQARSRMIEAEVCKAMLKSSMMHNLTPDLPPSFVGTMTVTYLQMYHSLPEIEILGLFSEPTLDHTLTSAVVIMGIRSVIGANKGMLPHTTIGREITRTISPFIIVRPERFVASLGAIYLPQHVGVIRPKP